MSSTEKESELELELECSLCKDIYREPKTLGCLHTFCLECLEIYVTRNHSNVTLSCPICRTPFQSKSREQLANLPTDSYLLNSLDVFSSLKNSLSQQKNQKVFCLDKKNEATSYCLDCQEYFCDTCTSAHKTMKISKNHQVISIDEVKNQSQINSISNSKSQLYCQIHQDEEIKLFCNDCNLTICSLCVDQHPSHKISSLSSIMGNERQLLIDSMIQVVMFFFFFYFFLYFFLNSFKKKVKPKEKELQEGINKCEEMIKQLEINSTTTQTQIHEFFNKIRTKLDEKEQELLNQLDEMERYKKKELEIQKEELQFGIESIIGSCEMIENSISLSSNNKNDARLLSMKKLYQSRLDYLINNPWRIEPCFNPFIRFFISENEENSLCSSISNIVILDSNEISAEKCLISRNDQQRIYVNEEFKFQIISYSKEGYQMRKGGYGNKFEIKVEKESKSNNDKNDKNEKSKWNIMDLNNGKYEIKMKFKDEGKYSIFVQYDGMEINSSPFQIQIFSMKIKSYNEIKIFSKLKQRNYNEINQPKLTFGSNGNGNGQFSGPYGVAINLRGCLFISDYNNHRIQIFDLEGKFISMFGSKGNGNGQFSYPNGIAINSKGNVIVGDWNNYRTQIFDSKGNFISTFGTYGKENGQFNSPEAICVDNNDNIYVCDSNNNRIQIFDSEGKFISTFGSYGNGNGQFKYPRGITINSKGNIIVSDYNNNRIQIFDSERKFISTFGSEGHRNGQFYGPKGICVDKDDNIFVCDYGNSRIQIFTPNGVYTTQFKVNQPTDIIIHPNTLNVIVCGEDNKISIFDPNH